MRKLDAETVQPRLGLPVLTTCTRSSFCQSNRVLMREPAMPYVTEAARCCIPLQSIKTDMKGAGQPQGAAQPRILRVSDSVDDGKVWQAFD